MPVDAKRAQVILKHERFCRKIPRSFDLIDAARMLQALEEGSEEYPRSELSAALGLAVFILRELALEAEENRHEEVERGE